MSIEGVVKDATKSGEKGIRLHIDDGCMGEGETINHEWLGPESAKIHKESNFDNIPLRDGIFSYGILTNKLTEIPDIMSISNYDYGFVLRVDNEYLLADLEKCIAMYNPSSKDADNDELTYLGEIFYGTEPMKTDTDGDGIPDHRDRQPIKYNRRFGFIFSIVKYLYHPFETKPGLNLANNLADHGFQVYLVTDEDPDKINDDENLDWGGQNGGYVIWERINQRNMFFDAIDRFEWSVKNNKPSNYGDDIVVVYLSGHTELAFAYPGKFNLVFAGLNTFIFEGEIADAMDQIGTVDLLFISSCYSTNAFDEFEDEDNLFVIGHSGGCPICYHSWDYLANGKDNNLGLWYGYSISDAFHSLNYWDAEYNTENHLEYDLYLT